jgi:hypothetical protein
MPAPALRYCADGKLAALLLADREFDVKRIGLPGANEEGKR